VKCTFRVALQGPGRGDAQTQLTVRQTNSSKLLQREPPLLGIRCSTSLNVLATRLSSSDSYWRFGSNPVSRSGTRPSELALVLSSFHNGRTDLVLIVVYFGCTRVKAVLLYSSLCAPTDLFWPIPDQRMKRAPQRDCCAARAMFNARSGVHSVRGLIQPN
jgi:hypothetical protein